MIENLRETSTSFNVHHQNENVARTVTMELIKYYHKKITFSEDERKALKAVISTIITETLKGQFYRVDMNRLSKLSNITSDKLQKIVNKAPFFNTEENTEQTAIACLTPFVVCDNHVYMRRYWQAEQSILGKLKSINEYHQNNKGTAFAHTKPLALNLEELKAKLSPSQLGIVDLFCQNTSGITIVSGEAGSGKSWACAQLFKLLEKKQPQSIAGICAPTGKAVSRLSAEFTAINSRIEIQTIHQLLKISPHSKKAQYHSENLLVHEFLLIDEVSMIDIELFDKLLDAVRYDCKILLVGDPHQLAPVGMGGSLKMIQEHFPQNHIHLQEQYRFEQHSEIQNIAVLAKKGELFSQQLSPPHSLSADAEQREEILEQWIVQNLHPCYQQNALSKLLDKCVLSPWRNYEYGVINLNQLMQKKLYEAGLIDKAIGWCRGLIIVVRSNNFKLEVYNGDKAYIEQEGNQLYAIFVDKNHRKVPLEQLPVFDLAFAMTVHQTQGSEMNDVLLWLGDLDEDSNKWLSDNLLYTSVTRAKKNIQICANISHLSTEK